MSRQNRELVQVYGLRSCAEVLASNASEVVQLWFAKGARSAAVLRLKAEVQSQGLPFQELPRQALDHMSGFVRHQGVLMTRRPPRPSEGVAIDTLSARGQHEPLLLLALDHLQDPRNLGACLRSAEAAAVDAVLVSRQQSAGLSSVVGKAACGALEHVPVLMESDLAASLARLRQAGFWLVGMADEAEQGIWECDFPLPLVLIFGSEGQGLRKAVRRRCDMLLNIPMFGHIESLNVSVACGVTLYEIRRRYRTGKYLSHRSG